VLCYTAERFLISTKISMFVAEKLYECIAKDINRRMWC